MREAGAFRDVVAARGAVASLGVVGEQGFLRIDTLERAIVGGAVSDSDLSRVFQFKLVGISDEDANNAQFRLQRLDSERNVISLSAELALTTEGEPAMRSPLRLPVGEDSRVQIRDTLDQNGPLRDMGSDELTPVVAGGDWWKGFFLYLPLVQGLQEVYQIDVEFENGSIPTLTKKINVGRTAEDILSRQQLAARVFAPIFVQESSEKTGRIEQRRGV